METLVFNTFDVVVLDSVKYTPNQQNPFKTMCCSLDAVRLLNANTEVYILEGLDVATTTSQAATILENVRSKCIKLARLRISSVVGAFEYT